MGVKYSKREKEIFDQGFAEGKDILQIAIDLGRSFEHVRRRARTLGLIAKRFYKPLTRTQRKKLRKLVGMGLSAKVIADNQLLGPHNPPRSEHNIRNWMGRLRLVHKKRSRAAKRRKILKPTKAGN